MQQRGSNGREDEEPKISMEINRWQRCYSHTLPGTFYTNNSQNSFSSVEAFLAKEERFHTSILLIRFDN
jgi:hypothetical protein